MPSLIIDREFAEGIVDVIHTIREALDHLEAAVLLGLPPPPPTIRLVEEGDDVA